MGLRLGMLFWEGRAEWLPVVLSKKKNFPEGTLIVYLFRFAGASPSCSWWVYKNSIDQQLFQAPSHPSVALLKALSKGGESPAVILTIDEEVKIQRYGS